jgi:hypothetical protein
MTDDDPELSAVSFSRSYEGENLCAVSNQNTLLFLSSFPLLQEPVYNDISTAFPT